MEAKFKKGDKIIWNSGWGYEVGYFVKPDGVCYNTYLVDLRTGIATGEVSHAKDEIEPYTKERIKELYKKYKYLKEFSETF